jgi:hypothetical protein
MALEVTPLTSKRLRSWGAAGLALFGFWIALVGVLDPLELAVGAVAAVIGALAAAGVLARGPLPPLAVRRRAWTQVPGAVARIPPDLMLLARGFRARGSVSTLRLPSGVDWRHRAERGFAEMIGSLAPNAILFDASPDGDAQLHELVTRSGR